MPWKADDDDSVTGAFDSGGKSSGRGAFTRPSVQQTTMLQHWHHIVDDAVEECNGDPSVSFALFNRNIRELHGDGFEDPTIRAGFTRFSEMVLAHTIDVRGKPAWLVFWSRRRQLVRNVVYGIGLPERVVESPNPLHVTARPPPNPFGH